jgi:hypothetical protein
VLVHLESRNNVIFNNVGVSIFCREWALLLPEDQRDLMVIRCNRLLMVAQDFYSQAGWRLTRRLTS